MVGLEIVNGEHQRVFKCHMPQPALFHQILARDQNVEVRHAVGRVVARHVHLAARCNLHQPHDKRRHQSVNRREVRYEIAALV